MTIHDKTGVAGMMRNAVFVVCAAMSAFAVADGVTYGTLPAADADGRITLTESVEVADAEDAATLAAAKSLVIPEGMTLRYTSSEPLALSAAVSGAGVFAATNAGTITISADNSGLVSPGHFSFAATPVVVTDEHGLGGAESDAATFIGDLPAGNLLFAGTSTVFTNYAPIMLYKTKDKGFYRFGSDSVERTLVQAASFTATTVNSETHLYFTHNVEFIAGKLSVGYHPRFYREGDGTVRIGGDVDAEFGPSGQAIVYFYDLRLACRSLLSRNGLSPDAARNIIFERENCLSAETPLRPYRNSMDGGAFFNLNGFSQTVASLQQIGDTSYNGSIIASDAPATLTAVGTATGAQTVQYKILGPISYHHSTPWRTTFARYPLEATGALTVSDGEVAFTDGSGWAGDQVTVKSGGTLTCKSEVSLNSGSHVLTVEPGGTLHVEDGVLLMVRSATFGSVALDAATVYTLDEVRSLLDSSDGITLTGTGSIQTGATSVSGEWNGWPAAATEVAIPDGTTVEITDDDVDAVMALDKIVAGAGVKVVCRTKARTLNLKASVLGGAAFEFYDAGTVVISGDNSGLISPAGFSFSNTVAIVSNRFGLGGDRAAAARFCPAAPCTENISDLLFVGDAVTNDCPLAFNYAFRIGHIDPEVRFVQNADITQENGASSPWHRNAMYTNDFTIASNATFSATVLRALNGAVFRIEPGATLNTGIGNFGSGTYYIGGKITGQLAIEQCMYRFVFERAEALEVSECRFYDGSHKTFFFDLNGFDQTLPRVIGNQYTNTNQQCFDVTSATPATLTLNGAAGRDCGAAIRCLGAASLTYSGASTQTVGMAVSTTTGALTVNSGAIALEHGYRWLGTNVCVNGGSLIVRPTASADTFGTASETMAALHVNTPGTLELQSEVDVPTVRSVEVDGVELDSGTYSAANCGWITGPGSIRVLRGPRRSLRVIIR